MPDPFSSYETGLTRLLKRLGSHDPHYAEVLTLQVRLLENVRQARQCGDTETRRAEWAQIVNELNQLALETVGVTFNELCKPPQGQELLEKSEWNTAVIRKMLSDALSDEELVALCFDYFRPVHENFSAGMGKGQKVQRLLDYCERHDRIPELLDRVRDANPSKYAEFEMQTTRRINGKPIWISLDEIKLLLGCSRRKITVLLILAIAAFSISIRISSTHRSKGSVDATRTALAVDMITPPSHLTATSSPALTPIVTDTPTPTNTPTYAPTPSVTNTPTSTPTSTPIPTPTPDCSGVRVSYLELDLLTDENVPSVKYPDDKGEILLNPPEIDGLTNLQGRAELTVTVTLPGATVAEGCTCYWEGRTSFATSWKPITSAIGKCRFSIRPLPALVKTVYLSLTIGEQPPSRYLTIRVQR